MEIFYKKNNNREVFSNLQKPEFGNFKNVQNYIPIYSRFFAFNETNWNSINLNHNKRIKSITNMEDDNNYNIMFNNGKSSECFFKLAPIIDPAKYMIGKYKDLSDNDDYVTGLLPKYNEKTIDKVDDINNVAYTDGFFTYLSSKLKNNYNNPHCIDFYGSYLAIKQQYKINIYDDLEFLYNSPYFVDNLNKLYKLNGDIDNEFFNFHSRKNKHRLQFDKTLKDLSLNDFVDFSGVFQKSEEEQHTSNQNSSEHNSSDIIQLSDISDLEEFILKKDSEEETNITSKKDSDDDSACSSRSSMTSTGSDDNSETNNGDSEREDIDDNDQQENTCDENEDITIGSDSISIDLSSDSDEYLEAELPQFPVQIIAMEKMHMTLDKYIEEFDVSREEWLSIFMQIFMNLLTYKKAFNFTHNDLHTNNVMFIETDKRFLYYKFNKKFYKVPTFGKIFKIIDFGRSIYTFKGELICSDSYHSTGDAATQFNFGPYMNPDKPIIEPNYAFDLCRLACSLYDNFVQEDDDDEDISESFESKADMREYLKMKKALKDIEDLVKEWCNDDNNKNVLYKSNGKERYPGFKLYKMITRTVHKHTPEAQLEKPLFKKFIVKMRNINLKEVINIDAIKSEIK